MHKNNIFINILAMYIMLVSSAMAGENDGFTSIDIEKSELLGKTFKSIEQKLGKAKFVKGISSVHEKIFTRYDWDNYAWELYSAGHYLYRFKRNNNEVEYRVLYRYDTSKSKFHPTNRVQRLWIAFDQPPSINKLSTLIPEIKLFDNAKIKTFIRNESYLNETSILYLANPSESAGLIASGYKETIDGYGFGLEVILEQKSENPNLLSKVKEVRIDVFGINYLESFGYQPIKFIKLSKNIP